LREADGSISETHEDQGLNSESGEEINRERDFRRSDKLTMGKIGFEANSLYHQDGC